MIVALGWGLGAITSVAALRRLWAWILSVEAAGLPSGLR